MSTDKEKLNYGKQKVEIINESIDEGITWIRVGDYTYKVSTFGWFTNFEVTKDGNEVSSEVFVKLLWNLGYVLIVEHNESGSRASPIPIRTLEGVQGVYRDPDGERWYSAWNETKSKATK